MLILIGILSAILAGIGIGGGAIFVLLSTMFANVGQKEAQTLNLVLFVSVGISTIITNIKSKNIEVNLAKKVLPMLIFGCLIGTHLFSKINENNLKKYFNYFLLVIGIYEIITCLINMKKINNINEKSRKE